MVPVPRGLVKVVPTDAPDEVAKTSLVAKKLGEKLKPKTETSEATASEINIFFINF